MRNLTVNNDLGERKIELRKFGYVMAGFFGLIFGLFLPWLWSTGWPRWPWIVAAAFIFLATVWPMALNWIHKVWLRIGEVLGWINTRIILGIVYVLVFSPLGLVMRLFGHDTLRKKWDPSLKTYRTDKTPRKSDHMERQF